MQQATNGNKSMSMFSKLCKLEKNVCDIFVVVVIVTLVCLSVRIFVVGGFLVFDVVVVVVVM